MTEKAIFGGGCFWCIDPVFQALEGVLRVRPGYSGGHVAHPTYEQVCRQDTGHVEVICVEYDPDVVPYRTLLEVFFATHDPTSLDRQGGDAGPQYASVIFYLNDEQGVQAREVMAEVEEALAAPVCTRIEPAGEFWPAEGVHHDYYHRNPNQGYCQVVISPKLAKFRKRFAGLLRSTP